MRHFTDVADCDGNAGLRIEADLLGAEKHSPEPDTANASKLDAESCHEQAVISGDGTH